MKCTANNPTILACLRRKKLYNKGIVMLRCIEEDLTNVKADYVCIVSTHYKEPPSEVEFTKESNWCPELIPGSFSFNSNFETEEKLFEFFIEYINTKDTAKDIINRMIKKINSGSNILFLIDLELYSYSSYLNILYRYLKNLDLVVFKGGIKC